MLRKGLVMLLAVLLLSLISTSSMAKVKITYGGWLGDAEDEIMAKFMETHPNIEVERLVVKYRLIELLVGGQAPDIITWGFDRELIGQGVFLDLEPFMERDGFTLDHFRPGTRYLGLGFDGKRYGLPWGYGTLFVHYNADLVSKAGLIEPKEFGKDCRDWTIVELEQYAKRLTQDINGDGKLDQFGIGGGELWVDVFVPLYGGDWVDQESWKATVDRPEFIKAVEWVSYMNTQSYYAGGKPWEDFPAGIAGMIFQLEGGARGYIAQRLHEQFIWNFAYLPRAVEGEPYTFGWGNFMGINKQTRYVEEAWEFMKFYYTEGDPILAKYLAYPNTVSDKVMEVLESLGPAMGHPTLNLRPVYDPIPRTFARVDGQGLPASNEVIEILRQAVGRVVSGEESPAILRDAAERATAVLQKRAGELGLLK